MLAIPCRVRDELQIGDSISVVVLEVAEDHVRIGVTSPDQVPEYQEHTLFLASAVEDDFGCADEPHDESSIEDHRLVGA